MIWIESNEEEPPPPSSLQEDRPPAQVLSGAGSVHRLLRYLQHIVSTRRTDLLVPENADDTHDALPSELLPTTNTRVHAVIQAESARIRVETPARNVLTHRTPLRVARILTGAAPTMNITAMKTEPALTETIAVRLTLDECRALFELARQADRTVSYVVRAELRKFLRERHGAEASDRIVASLK
jgi:hypothetical protein